MLQHPVRSLIMLSWIVELRARTMALRPCHVKMRAWLVGGEIVLLWGVWLGGPWEEAIWTKWRGSVYIGRSCYFGDSCSQMSQLSIRFSPSLVAMTLRPRWTTILNYQWIRTRDRPMKISVVSGDLDASSQLDSLLMPPPAVRSLLCTNVDRFPGHICLC